jgi:hypothetical protein
LARHSATDTAAPMSDGTARGWQRLARTLPLRPLVHAALRAGEISPRHAEVLLTQLTQLDTVVVGTSWNTPEWLAAQEQAFLDLARLTDPVTLQRELGKRLQALAPEPAAKDHAEQVAERRASLTPGFDGTWTLTATLDPHSGQVLRAALEAFRRTDHTAQDHRTPAQRDVDALVGLAHAWLAAGSTRQRGVAPQLIVTVPEARLAAHQTLRDARGRPLTLPTADTRCLHPSSSDCTTDCSTDCGERLPDPFTQPLFTRDGQLLSDTEVRQMLDDHGAADTNDLLDLVPPATYPDGTPLPEHTLDELLCTATLTRLVLDQDSAVIDVGRASRVFTHPQWLATMTSWQWQCATDGCPGTRIEVHHARWWRDGGTTDLANAVPLCHGTSSCHTRVHQGATLRLRDGRVLDRHGLHTPDNERDETVWPPPLPARPTRQSRTAATAQRRLDRLLSTAA